MKMKQVSSLEIHKNKELQLCLRALFLRSDISFFIKQFADAKLDVHSPSVEQVDLVHQMREECRSDEQFTLDQLQGIAVMLETFWKKADKYSAYLQYSNTPTIYNTLLHFVDYGTLVIKDNSDVVCRWKDILRWHTLSSTLGEDLLVCAYLASSDLKNAHSGIRNDFAWPAFIKTDDPTLEAMLEMPLADIHAHLKGSSLNFDINWICLMNHIDGREEQFKTLASFTQGTNNGRRTYIQLYRDAIVAAAIRLYLAQHAMGAKDFPIKELMVILKAKVDESVLGMTNHLQEAIQTALFTYGKSFIDSERVEKLQLDYAIRNGVTVPRGKQESCAYSLLSGERHILYSTLKGIYDGKYNDGRIATLLFIYLLIKNEIRHEISQLNDTTGFKNFSVYEERKLIFAKEESYEVYKKAAIHLAVASFFGDRPEGSRYHETRITPEVRDEKKNKDALELNIEEIDFNDRAIDDPMFKTRRKDTPWPYRYIYHFIKESDNTDKEYLGVKPRHYELRDKVKAQSEGIWALRNSLETDSRGCFYADRIVGIDAANSEIACRPEVFAQAFRFLRRHQITKKQEHCPADLGITYHVGEDFMDIVDGLRAVDEALRFLQLQKGDRIGHGLVLGVDVERYYELRNYTVALSLQMQMDNAAWLWNKMVRLGIRNKTKEELERRYGECFRRVYPKYGWTPDIDLYYSSMLLRGDNPECYDASGRISNPYDPATEWGTKALVRSKECDDARQQKEVCKLYYLYHYDKDGKQNGGIFDTWEVDEEMCKTIELVQRDLLRQVEKDGIAIECNPTSNFKIGEIDRYDRHPITTFNSIRHAGNPKEFEVSVSINTDDKGVFSTSIEREYALVAHSIIRKCRLEDNNMKDSDVYEWLDNIRLHSLNQRFDKSVTLQSNPERETLTGIKKRISEEMDDEIRGLKFVDRLKYCWTILLGKKNG